ncbi:MAG TPA: hypothetical protein VFP97_00200 [Chitinophagaceae bacterium]|nr:hypothetical protein [Chitinophagaceae bacterium]
MADDRTAINLPTELISEKTFYTLGGASAGVWLTCWAINYVAVDVSWLNYKTYRLIAILLSEALAIYIMYKTKKKESMKWLFAFLNGLLIFVNASGLNTMTASYIFDPTDTTAVKNTGDAHRQLQNNSIMKAAIFPFPRMVSWWPDKKLVEEYEGVKQENVTLAAENQELKTVMAAGDEGSKVLLSKNDSLVLVINSMQMTIDDRQKQIDQLTETIRNGSDDFSKRLSECMEERTRINNELRACQLSVSQANASITELKAANARLRQELKTCGSKDATLAMLCQQVCNRISLQHRSDQSLMQQNFYRRMAWAGFCESFNSWNNRIE